MNEHIGELHPTKDGKYFYKIIDWVDNKNVTVELLNDNFQPHYTRVSTYQNIRKHLHYPGSEIRHPNFVSLEKLERKAYWEGKVVETKDGTAKYEIVDYQNAHCVKIHFIDTLCYQMREVSSLVKNSVANPFPITDKGETPICFDDTYKQYIGAYFYTSGGRKDLQAGKMPNPSDIYRIIEYDRKGNATVQFQDAFGYTAVVGMSSVLAGTVSNRYRYNGLTKDEIDYMIETTLNAHVVNKYRSLKLRETDPSYRDVLISDEWNNYGAFKSWYINAVSILNPKYIKEYTLDKDLKYPYYASYTNNKKLYSPSTVVILPNELNVRIKYIFDPAKSENIMECANYYYSENAITKETYDMIVDQINKANGRY